MSVNINIIGSQLVIGSQPEVGNICLRLTTEQIKKLCSIGTVARNKSALDFCRMLPFLIILSYMGVPSLLLASYGFYLFSLNPKFSLYPIPLWGINTPQYIIYYIESWEPQIKFTFWCLKAYTSVLRHIHLS